MLDKRRKRQLVNSLIRGQIPELGTEQNMILMNTGLDSFLLNGNPISKEQADEFQRLNPCMEDISLTLNIS